MLLYWQNPKNLYVVAMNENIPYPIPRSWEWTKLGDIAEIVRLQVNPQLKPKDKFNYLSIENIESHSGELVNFAPTEGEKIKSAKIAFTTSDLLYSKLRPYLNKVHLPTFDGISATDLIPIRPLGGILREYVAYFMRTRLVVVYVNQRMRGIQLPRVPLDDLLKLPVPVAPIAEQRRIVDKVEKSFVQITSAKQALHRVPDVIKQFRQSALGKAFRGELTERDSNEEAAEAFLEGIRLEGRRNWEGNLRSRGKNPMKYKYEEPKHIETSGLERLPEGWSWTTLGSVLEVIQYGTSVKASATPDKGVPILRMGNIQEGNLDLSNLKYMGPEEDIQKYQLKEGDILINRTNSPELVGKCALFQQEGKYVFASYLIRLRALKSVASSEYLTYVINSSIGRRHVDAVKHQVAGQSNINTQDIKSMPIPLAPLQEQFKIAEKIRQMFSRVDEILEAVNVGLKKAEALERAVLLKAFRAELLPQEPDDEPASVLLEKIRASRRTLRGTRGRPQTALEITSHSRITPKA